MIGNEEMQRLPGESTNAERVPIPKVPGQGCFACGTANPIGLHLNFYRSGNTVCSDITLGKHYEGWQNMAHGGIISTLVDEVMSWAVMYFKKSFFVTRKMELKYIRPVPIGVPLTVKAKVTDSSEPPKVRAQGEIRDEKGSLYVRSSAEFVLVPREGLTSVSDQAKGEMISLFDRFE
jgi:uncharacterized protein (TIGR00369 family)